MEEILIAVIAFIAGEMAGILIMCLMSAARDESERRENEEREENGKECKD